MQRCLIIIIGFFLLFGVAQKLSAQITLINPAVEGGFENATSTLAANGWTVVDGTAVTWFCGTAAGAASGTKAAFVGSNNTTYAGSSTGVVKHFYRDIVIPAGATQVYLNYSLKMPIIDNTYDYLYIYTNTSGLTPVSGTIPSGGTWVQRLAYTTPAIANFTAQPQIDLTSLAGTTTRLCFTYKTDGASPYANPAVDNISLTYVVAPTGCTNTSQYPSSSFAAPSIGAGAYTISTVQYQSEYNQMTGAVAGNTFTSTASIAGTYITVRAGTYNGTVVTAGTTPLNWTATAGGTYFIHYNTNSSCGTASTGMTTTITNTTPLAGCTNTTLYPSAFTAPAPGSASYTISSAQYQSEYNQMNSATAGNNFTSTASIAGTYITVRAGSYNGSVVASGTTPLAWTATAGGTYYIHYNTNSSCGTASTGMTTTITNTTPVPAPSCATYTSPSNGATNQNAGSMTLIWTAATYAASYDVYLGTAPSPPLLGNVVSTGATITNIQPNTTYYWKIVPINGTGSATGCATWSFTTGSNLNMTTGSATVCSGNFYDSQGVGGSASTSDVVGNYLNGESYTYTVYPATPGTKLRVDFSNFALETCCDLLGIYNGNSTAAPLIGTFTTNPGSITSTAADGSLTFWFTSDVSINYLGWEASFSCCAPGNPATFGSGQWNIYGYDGNDINLGGSLSYRGFYTETALSYNTANRWGGTVSPSSANATGGSAWSGCAVGVDNHTVVAKRTGFATGTYQIDIPTHDDGIQVWVNGVKVFENLNCCVQHTAVWTGTLNSGSTVEIRQAEGVGGSGHAVTITQLGLSATPSKVDPTPFSCATNGSVTISSPSGGLGCVIASSDFTTAPGSVALTGTATVTSGYLQLTTTINGQQGNAIISMPSANYNVTDFVAEFDIFATAAGGADGMSFSYGGDVPTNAGSETGVSNTGLQIGFIEYTSSGGPKIEIRYNNVLLQNTGFANLANSTWRQCVVRVNSAGQLTLTLGGTAIATNLTLPGYATANKVGWKMAFSARTGGLNNAHLVDNLNIVAYSQYEYSINNTTWFSTNVFSNLGIGAYTPYVRNICQAASPLTLAAQTLSATATPGNPATYGTNQWNVYAYNGSNLNTYFGFYTTNRTSEFNIGSDGVGATSNPSIVTGGTINGATVGAYSGCALGNDNWSISAKRQGFPCGVYSVNLVGHDDEYILNIDFDGNGTVDFTSTAGCCDIGLGTKWTGVLNANSRVEIILKEGGGDAYVDIDFVNITSTLQGGTIAGITSGVTICTGTDPGAFTSTAAASAGASAGFTGGSATYQWESAPTSAFTTITNVGTNSLTYDPGTLTTSTWFRRKVTDACGAVAYSNAIEVVVVAQPTVTITGNPANGIICSGGTCTLTAAPSGGTGCTTYQWQFWNGSSWANTGSGASTLGAGSSTDYRVIISCAAGSGCTVTSSPFTVTVNPDPINPTLNTKTPNTTSVCAGTSVSATFNAGSGGVGCTDDYQFRKNGGSWAAYTPGSSITTTTGDFSVEIQGRRANCTGGLGCSINSYVVLASWTVDALSVAPTSITGTSTICNGSSTTLTLSGGTAGTGANAQWFAGSCGSTVIGTGNSITVSPSSTTTYFVRYAGTCNTTSCASVTVTVTPLHTLTLTSAAPTANQTVCNGIGITNITYTPGGGATSAGVTGLPTGVTGNFSGGVLTISGTPTADGVYNYTVTTSGNGCPVQTLNGSITVRSLIDWANLQFPPSATICPSGSVTVYGRLYEPGVTPAAGAPSGVVAELGYSSSNTNPNTWTNWTTATYNVQVGNDDEFMGTLSGLAAGTYYYAFRYSLNGCVYQYGGMGGFWSTGQSGVLTVSPNHAIALSSVAGTNAQALCQNIAITNITYNLTGGATGASVTGLPPGISSNVVGSTLTINGTPTSSGSFSYSITTTGNSCATANASGTITVHPKPTATTCKADDPCQTASGQITVNISGGTTPYTINYTKSGVPQTPINTSNANTPITGLQGGQVLNFTITDNNGCTAQ